MNRNGFGLRSLKWLALALALLACVVYAIYLGHAIYVERALYADGSFFFVDLLSHNHGWPISDDEKHVRLFANILNQFPSAVAVQLGVESLVVLKILFGASLFLGPFLAYIYCFFLSRRANNYRVFLFSIASLVTCAIPSDIFIVNQSFISLALVWVLLHYLLLNIDIRRYDWVVISFVSLLLFRAHENLIFWGGLIFIGAVGVIRFGAGGSILREKRHLYMLGFAGLAQALFVIYWQMTHPVGEQTNAFLQLIDFAMPQEMWLGNTRISLLATALLVVAMLYGACSRSVRKTGVLLSGLFLLLFLSLSIYVLYFGASAIQNLTMTDPRREFNYRFLMTFGSSGWMLLSIVFVLARINIDVRAQYLAIGALSVGLLSASMWQISNSLQWLDFKVAAFNELNTSSGPIVQPELVREKLQSEGRDYLYKYRWDWTWPVFGMSLQADGRVVKMYKPEGFEAYFNPPEKIPFLRRSVAGDGSVRKEFYSFDEFQRAGKTEQ
ncbi:hypothetical protein [Pseudomonas jessenii]|uniref:Glycosyltransferase RgtA/B/C/D-like domain-containing protein n=1 Tax=Pseudomonas jessenii TaxID=77298 RepID=A0A370SAR5_PSEJE|nr:hypothetical protein [Pseudomonas jessenii]RDL16859.1 hypothetical protein DEU51_11245 [Pseudomonas jessenii]